MSSSLSPPLEDVFGLDEQTIMHPPPPPPQLPPVPPPSDVQYPMQGYQQYPAYHPMQQQPMQQQQPLQQQQYAMPVAYPQKQTRSAPYNRRPKKVTTRQLLSNGTFIVIMACKTCRPGLVVDEHNKVTLQLCESCAQLNITARFPVVPDENAINI